MQPKQNVNYNCVILSLMHSTPEALDLSPTGLASHPNKMNQLRVNPDRFSLQIMNTPVWYFPSLTSI